jgi:hypothetical protein
VISFDDLTAIEFLRERGGERKHLTVGQGFAAVSARLHEGHFAGVPGVVVEQKLGQG